LDHKLKLIAVKTDELIEIGKIEPNSKIIKEFSSIDENGQIFLKVCCLTCEI